MRKLTCCFTLLILAITLLLCLPAALGQKVPSAACPLHAQLTTTASGATQLIAAPAATTSQYMSDGTMTLTATRSIYICNATMRVKQPAVPADFGLIVGKGTNCATAPADLTPQWKGTADGTDYLNLHFGSDASLIAPAGTAVCFRQSAISTAGQVLVTYAVL